MLNDYPGSKDILQIVGTLKNPQGLLIYTLKYTMTISVNKITETQKKLTYSQLLYQSEFKYEYIFQPEKYAAIELYLY